MIQIPLQPIPNQELSVVLDGQNCVINLRQMGGFMFLTLTADDVKICDAHVCQAGEPIPVWGTPLFSGRLFFVDQNGKFQAPGYEELDTRFVLYYATADEWQALTERKTSA